MAKLIGDQLFPASIDDSLAGTAGDDYLFGGELNDTLDGGDGVDSIDGGTGNADWITFSGVTGGIDINLFAVAVPATPTVLMSVDEATAGVVGFDTTSTIVDDPAGGSNQVVRVVKGSGALGAAGTTMFTGANQSVDVIPFTADSTTMTLRVYMPVSDPGVRVRLKVENASNNQQTCEADAFTEAGAGWQTLTFDFANAATNGDPPQPTARLDLDHTFNKVSVFFNFGLSTAQGGGGTFYFDDLTFVASPDPAGTIADDGFGNTESIANVENVLGSAFADRITGGDGANVLKGEDGNDTIDGGAGNDNLTGGLGNDVLLGGAGIDKINGGDGSDTVSFTGAANGVDLTIRSGPSTTDVVTFEEATAPFFISFGPDDANPAQADAVIVSIATDPDGGTNKVGKFEKNAGAFTWAGTVVSTAGSGSGGNVGTLPFTANDHTMTMRVWSAAAGTDVLLKLESTTSPGASVGAEATTTKTGWNDLTFDFGPALPGPGTGALDLNIDYNKVVLFFNFGRDGATGGGTFYFDDIQFIGTAVSSIDDDGFGNAEGLTSVENAIGSGFADSLAGDGQNNRLAGAAGNDTLNGGAGNDSLDGGTGNDSLVGGTGNDSYTVDSSTDRAVEASGGGTNDIVTSSASYTLGVEVERLTLTGSSALSGTGNTLANTITGNTGANLLAGGSGNDTISGGSGNDSLDGGTGTDSLVGGTGNDSYTVDSATDIISETTTVVTEIDSVTSSVAWTLGSNLEKLTLTGSSALSGTGNTLANTITGNTGANALAGGSGNDTISGGSGNDSLDGGTGTDSLVGGTGNDSYTVDSATDVISETTTTATEIDSVISSATWTLGSNLEKLTLTGSSTINGTGNTLANTITGNTANNVLSGLAGNDTLTGGTGNDKLDGGTGTDSLVGGTGNDSYTVDSATDVISETTTTATEIDSVISSATWTLGSNLEKLTLTGSSTINGTGNTLANTITGNTANNVLSGLAGNDTLTGGTGNDKLDGGTGTDSLVGGTGNDSYVVDVTSDIISETSTLAAEIDSVSSAATWTLGSNLERLTLTGSSTINGTGNTLANTITGNGGNNILSGLAGNDTLSGGSGNDKVDGGTGNDSLAGGTGLDTFRFSSALNASTNIDRISDYVVADDRIELENSVFTKLTVTGVLSSANFVASSSGNAVDSNDFVLYETDTGQLFYDADGSGSGSKVLVATLTNLAALTSADIFVT